MRYTLLNVKNCTSTQFYNKLKQESMKNLIIKFSLLIKLFLKNNFLT
jgi:hypothetical protein